MSWSVNLNQLNFLFFNKIISLLKTILFKSFSNALCESNRIRFFYEKTICFKTNQKTKFKILYNNKFKYVTENKLRKI